MYFTPVFVMVLTSGLFAWDAGWASKFKVALAVLWRGSAGVLALRREAPRRSARRKPPMPAWLVFVADGLACVFLATGAGPRITSIALACVIAVFTLWFTMGIRQHAKEASAGAPSRDPQP